MPSTSIPAGNSFSDATRLSTSGSHLGYLGQFGNFQDYFLISPAQSGEVTFNLTGQNGSELSFPADLVLYDNSFQFLEQSLSPGRMNNALSYSVDAGEDYFLLIRQYSGSGTYQLSARFSPDVAPPLPTEPSPPVVPDPDPTPEPPPTQPITFPAFSSDPHAPSNWSTATPVSGSLRQDNMQDVFDIPVVGSGVVTISVSGLTDDVALWRWTWSESGGFLGGGPIESSNGRTSFEATLQVNAVGNEVVSLRYFGDTGTNYRLSHAFESGPVVSPPAPADPPPDVPEPSDPSSDPVAPLPPELPAPTLPSPIIDSRAAMVEDGTFLVTLTGQGLPGATLTYWPFPDTMPWPIPVDLYEALETTIDEQGQWELIAPVTADFGRVLFFEQRDDEGNRSERTTTLVRLRDFDQDLLSLQTSHAWADTEDGITSVDGAVVHLGHVQGHPDLLRIENGSVTVTGGTVTVEGQVFSGRHDPQVPLFDGRFQINTQTLAVSGFEAQGAPYPLLDDAVGLAFGGMALGREEVRLSADARFGGVFGALDTQDAPLLLRIDDDGLAFQQTEFSLTTAERLNLPVPGAPMALQFSDLGFSFDGLEQVLYLHGKAAVEWGGPLAGQLAAAGVDSGRLELNLAKAADSSGNDKFLALRLDAEGQPAWDLVGEIGYRPGGGLLGLPIKELRLGLNSIEQSFSGAVQAELPFSPPTPGTTAPTATGTVRGLWDPLRLDALSFSLDNLNYPLGTTGLFLNGGSIGVAGLAASNDEAAARSYTGDARFTLGTSAGGAPTPIRGKIEGSFGDSIVSGGFEIDSRLGYFLGDTASRALNDGMLKYFRLDPAALLDFSLFSLSGSVQADLGAAALTARLDAEVLQGVYTGTALMDLRRVDGSDQLVIDASGRVGLPEGLGGAGLRGNVRVEFSDDGDFSNDFVAAWGGIGTYFGRDFDIGFKLGFDGSFSRLGMGGEPIPKTNSWVLDGAEGYTLLSTFWDTPLAQAELIVTTPDGTQIHERDFATHPNVLLVDMLNTDTSRHVLVRDAGDGLWQIGLQGDVEGLRTEANALSERPELALSIDAVDAGAQSATILLKVSDALEAGQVTILAGTEPGVASGQALATLDLAGFSGSDPLTLDLSALDDGVYALHAVLQAPGLPPVIALADTPVILGSADGVAILGDTSGAVTNTAPETQTAAGRLELSIPSGDPGPFAMPDEGALDGRYGRFSFDPEIGAWHYTLDPDSQSIRTLAPGDTATESLTVKSLDGTAFAVIAVDVEVGSVALAGTISTRSGAPLAGAEITATLPGGSTQSAFADADGGFTLSALPPRAGTIAARHDLVPEAANITPGDALEILRIAVGLAPSFGAADALTFIAADVNQDGRVTAEDALEVLRHAVGLPTDNASQWVFIDSNADLSAITASNVAYATDILLAGHPADQPLDMTAVLLGSMREML